MQNKTKEITLEQYNKAKKDKKIMFNNLIFFITISIILSTLMYLITNSKYITIATFTILLIISLGIPLLIMTSYNKIINNYKQQELIRLEKEKIKIYLNKTIYILKNFLEYDDKKIENFTNKNIDRIFNAQTLEDFNRLHIYLKNEYLKYKEIMRDTENYNTYNETSHSNFKYDYYDYNDYFNKSNNKSQTKDEKLLERLIILELTSMPKTKEELKNQYRKLLKKYHPDNALKINLTEDELVKKTAKINVTYNEIIKLYFS